jgi:hypothetical protein
MDQAIQSQNVGLSVDDVRLLREVADRQAITEKLYLYCRACDRLDLELMSSIFWPEAIAHHGTYVGPADGFWRGALFFLSRIEAALHYATNVIVEVDGDHAYQESIFYAWHRVQKGEFAPASFSASPYAGDLEGADDMVFDGFPGHDITKDEDAIFCGRYVNKFERRQGEWRIIDHICFVEWEHWQEASERSPVALHNLARRDRTDPVYQR